MCPGCRALVDAGVGDCPYCGWSLAQTEVRKRGGVVERLARPFGGVVPVLIFTNALLALATVAVQVKFVPLYADQLGLRTVPDAGTLAVDGILNPLAPVLELMGGWRTGRFLEGEWWRLLCPMFLHGGILHIGVNMMALRNIGGAVEEAYGSGKALALYLLSGIAGSLGSLSWYWIVEATGRTPGDIVSIGASGAIIGYAGILAALGFRIGGEQGKALWGPMVKAVGFILVLGIVLAMTKSRIQIDNSAHVGGFLFGLGSGFTCTFGVRSRGNLVAVRAWNAVAVILVLAVAAAFVPAALQTTAALLPD